MTSNGPSYKKQVLILIAAIGIIRLILAFTVDLGNDESYYWFFAQHLKWNYFDHPPMVALLIKATTLNLKLQDYPGFLRLGSVISCCIATWFMYKSVALISNERAGFIAACLYNASYYAGITAGIFIIPDSPQMVFWTWSLWLIARLLNNENKRYVWILFGVSTGLCIMSKVHGVFIWVGFGLYILLLKRDWLRNINLYISVAISFLICLPILIWNIKNNFITYQFDSERINIYGVTHNWFYFIKEVCGQLIINNPFNVILIFAALTVWKKRRLVRLPALTVFNFIGLLHAGILLMISAYKETLPHWSGPAYITLLPLAAVYLDKKTQKKLPVFVNLALGAHMLVLLLSTWLIYFYPGNFGISSGRFTGYGDISLDWYGWKQAGEKFDSLYKDYQRRNITTQQTPVICYKWWGAHIEYYFCRPQQIKMIGLGSIMDLHEYMWMNDRRKNSVNMQNAFCIVPSDEFYNVKGTYKNYYNEVDSVSTIQILRGDKPAHDFYVYHLSGWKGKVPIR